MLYIANIQCNVSPANEGLIFTDNSNPVNLPNTTTGRVQLTSLNLCFTRQNIYPRIW